MVLEKFPKKYIPSYLSLSNSKTLKSEIKKSQKHYKKGKYYTRKNVTSAKAKGSQHVRNAKKIYGVKTVKVGKDLANKTGCSIEALSKIMKKGQGAYFTGSRPNQTPHSWGIARLSSAITGGKSSAVDFKILQNGCDSTSKALGLAKKARIRHNKGTRKVPKRKI
jgi:exo-beta-1,3-glucanase (GH17 family)